MFSHFQHFCQWEAYCITAVDSAAVGGLMSIERLIQLPSIPHFERSHCHLESKWCFKNAEYGILLSLRARFCQINLEWVLSKGELHQQQDPNAFTGLASKIWSSNNFSFLPFKQQQKNSMHYFHWITLEGKHRRWEHSSILKRLCIKTIVLNTCLQSTSKL